eukprot:gnl/Trimastix_PCT/3123.p1 GENE.gnl/Trimastix_PCT/3123~~gnl/Trimastix_PCT/3123.p1  ORF type:complete len:490 (-),score=134.27 gnl/Trimastix_PCT/3123:250-1719(-)
MMAERENVVPPRPQGDPHLYELIIRQLIHDGYSSAALSVSEATSTPMMSFENEDPALDSKEPMDRLHTLVSLGVLFEKCAQGESLTRMDHQDSAEDTLDEFLCDTRQRSLEYPINASLSPAVGAPTWTTHFIATHKGAVRCASFSPDGVFLATASEDTTIKLMAVNKLQRHGQNAPHRLGLGSAESEDYLGQPTGPMWGQAPGEEQGVLVTALAGSEDKPVLKTFYDHTEAIVDLAFHPNEPLLCSGSADRTIKLFPINKPSMKRAKCTINDTHEVRSLTFHPSGDYLVVGTEHPILRIYDVRTLSCYCCPNAPDHHQAPITHVRYSPTAAVYASADTDGVVHLWDTVTNRRITHIRAHEGSEITSMQFSANGNYLLTGGMDGQLLLWELRQMQKLEPINPFTCGPKARQVHGVFTANEDHIIGATDDPPATIFCWDARSRKHIGNSASGHLDVIRSLTHSPVEPCFVTCCQDYRARFWTTEFNTRPVL